MAKELDIVSWNVHLNTFAYDNNYVVETLESLNEPDIVCLQEYVGGRDEITRTWFDEHDYELAYLPFASFPSDARISQGVMTATKKILQASVEPIVLREDQPRRFRNFPNIRGLLDCTIRLGQQDVHILNFHATFPRPYTVDLRQREFASLVGHLEKYNEGSPMLLCGDFNFFGKDTRKERLTTDYDSFTGTRTDKTWRHKNGASPLRANLDYLFWTKDSLDVDAKLLPFNVSDHRPIHACFTMI